MSAHGPESPAWHAYPRHILDELGGRTLGRATLDVASDCEGQRGQHPAPLGDSISGTDFFEGVEIRCEVVSVLLHALRHGLSIVVATDEREAERVERVLEGIRERFRRGESSPQMIE